MGRQSDKARWVAEDCVLEKNSSEHPPGVSMIWSFFPQSRSVPSQVFSADVSAIGREAHFHMGTLVYKSLPSDELRQRIVTA
ncbi:unnamed protein product [Sphagnum balticum]